MSETPRGLKLYRNWYAPGRSLLLVGLLVLGLAGASAWWTDLLPVLALSIVAVVLLALWDGWRLMRLPLPEVHRELESNWPVAVWRPVAIKLQLDSLNIPSGSIHLELFDWSPESFEVRPTQSQGVKTTHQGNSATEVFPASVKWAGNNTVEFGYEARAMQRGDAEFSAIDLLMRSPWSWWQRRSRLSVQDKIKIYPNYAELKVYLQLARQDRLNQLGIHQFVRRGQGGDFHQLRDYRAGDTLRQVDWKATSRRQKLISREYQEDRDQQLLLLLDCGRRMRHQGGQRGHLDDSLDAMLLLAFSALRQGDAVGFMSFGGDDRWQAPRKGAATIHALLEAVYDLQAHAVASDYLAMAMRVLSLQKRRSLVILLTNTRDEDYTDLLQAACLLRQRHWVVIADIREALLDQWSHMKPKGLPQALEFLASQDYLQARDQAHRHFGHQGVQMLDVLPEQLAPALVNEYQRMKRSGQLAV